MEIVRGPLNQLFPSNDPLRADAITARCLDKREEHDNGQDQQRNVRPEPVPGNRFATCYTIENLEPGTYEVAVRLPPGRCAGGRWSPPQKKFTLGEWTP